MIPGDPPPSRRVRPQSRTKQHRQTTPEMRYRRILVLPFYDEIYEKLCRGWAVSTLAHDIIERGYNTDIGEAQLSNILRSFRDEMIPATDLAEHALPSVHKRAVEKVEEGLNVLDELERLYRLQARRVSLEVVDEERNKKLRASTVRELKEAREILKTYHKVQSDMGLVQRKLGQIEVSGGVPHVVVAQQFGEAAARLTGKKKNVTNVLDVFRKVMQLSATEYGDDEEEEEPAVGGGDEPEVGGPDDF